MPYVIAEPCVNTKDTACVEVCPVDCIHPTKDAPEFEKETMLYIDPDECIDCGACEPECPVEAIFEESDLSEDQKKWIEINAEKAPDLPVITEKEEPLPTAEDRKKELGF